MGDGQIFCMINISVSKLCQSLKRGKIIIHMASESGCMICVNVICIYIYISKIYVCVIQYATKTIYLFYVFNEPKSSGYISTDSWLVTGRLNVHSVRTYSNSDYPNPGGGFFSCSDLLNSFAFATRCETSHVTNKK